MMQENKENYKSFSNKKYSPRKPVKKLHNTPEKKFYDSLNNSPVLENTNMWQQQSDATFETIERMCNKTLSDPENSIHGYLASWDEKHSQSSKSDEDVVALNDLFENIVYYSTDLNDFDNIKLANQTNLSEIEPPSCLWENTVSNETFLPNSPVKIVGLLRPSTILEESATESVSSSNSFKSAQPPLDTASSDQYETAKDNSLSTRPSERQANASAANTILSTDSGHSTTSKPDASAYFEAFPLRKIPYGSKPKGTKVYNKSIFLNGGRKHSNSEESLNSSNSTSRGISSLSMDSLEKPRRRRSRSSKFLVDSLDGSGGFENVKSKPLKSEKISNKSKTVSKDSDESSVILISDDEGDSVAADTSGDTTNSDLNKGFLKETDEPTDDSVISSESSDVNVSREFNNTLEEIEYIMAQGRKYLLQKPSSPAKRVEITPKVTPRQQKTPMSKGSPVTPNTVIRKLPGRSTPVTNKSISPLHAKAMLRSRNQARLDSRFDHIISPIRTYIHNTPKSPITATMKPTQNIFDSKFGRDSRTPNRNVGEKEKSPSKALCSLPRKAYVSSDYRHIVDQRSPISIPGGDKIHRYLETGMAPTVLKHEGKFKTNLAPLRQKSDLDRSKGSLADFSLASGDMSILVMKDAKDLASNLM